MKKLLIGTVLMMTSLGAVAPVLAGDCGENCASSCSSSTGKAYEDCMLNCLNNCLENDPPQVPDVPAPTPVDSK